MYDLSLYSGYRTKAHCARLYAPASAKDIVELFQSIGSQRVHLLAGGWNTVFQHTSYDTDVFVSTRRLDATVSYRDGSIVAGAAAMLDDVCEFAAARGITGFENLVGIPSTVGGAIAMNAGAFGTEIADVLHSAEMIDPRSRETYCAGREALGFKRRCCTLLRSTDHIVLRAVFRAGFGKEDAIRSRMREVARRRSGYPTEPNCGSVFVSDPSNPPSKRIDELGLKGLRRGAASVSMRHAGFIVVDNAGAAGADVVGLIHHLQDKLYDMLGTRYEIEQRII